MARIDLFLYEQNAYQSLAQGQANLEAEMAQKNTSEQRDEIEISTELEDLRQSLQNIRKTVNSGFGIWRGRVQGAIERVEMVKREIAER